MAGEKDSWEFYTDKAGEHRWRRKATNGEIVGAACEGYSSKAGCEANARRHGWKAGEEEPEASWAKDSWEFYEDKAGEHRWRRTASNGEIVGAACEGYTKKADCLANAQRHGYTGD